MQDIRPCRIRGLASARGQTLNGTAASAPFSPNDRSEGRISVRVEGHPSPLSLKRSNVEFFPPGILDGGVGIGRNTLRDASFNATAVDNFRVRLVAPKKQISGTACRCGGNLVVVLDHLMALRAEGNDDGIVIMCTDLNVSRAVDIMATGESLPDFSSFGHGTEVWATGGSRDRAMDLQDILVSIKDHIRELCCQQGVFVVANYRPHRLMPDLQVDLLGRGEERCRAVLSGHFAIYPCLDAKHFDAMEVRYIDTSSSMCVRHETYLDYGPGEAELYVKNAAALGETERLSPEVLAQVDPQAFWAAVLHIKGTLSGISALGDAALLGKWEEGVQTGVCNATALLKEKADATKIKLPTVVTSGESPIWSDILKSDDDQEKVASGCSNVALLMMLEVMEEAPHNGDEMGARPAIDILDTHRLLDIAGLALSVESAKQNDYDHMKENGPSISEDDRAAFMKKALEAAEYGNGVYVESDPLESCKACGKTDALKICSKCNGVAYCSTECARSCWRAHKKDCRPSSAHIKRSILHLASKYDIVIDPVNPATNSSPTAGGLLSEATGTGCCGTLLSSTPGQPSIISLTEQGQAPGVGKVIQFRNPLELEPPVRFLLACGPLANIGIARDCVDEVIRMTNGQLSKLRMQCVQFSPLDWAAKRGNADIVEWLCTDDRTKSLIDEGAPVGWACYTGQVDIARKLVAHGADATKDNVCFWNCPPLLMAAENGQLNAMKYLVEELGQDINMVGPSGRNVIESITTVPDWREIEGHRESHEWASRMLGRG